MIEKLKQTLVEDEGLMLKPYTRIAGKLTIGVGRNIEDRGLTEAEAMFLLSTDIEIVLQELGKNLPWFESAPEAVRMVLANMCFNMGITRLLTFQETLAYLERGEYFEASLEILNSLWAKQVGTRAERLSRLISDLA